MTDLAKEENPPPLLQPPTQRGYLHDYFEKDLDPTKACVIYDDGRSATSLSYDQVDKIATRITSCLRDADSDLRGFIGVLSPMNQFFPSLQLGILRSGSGFLNLGGKQWEATASRARTLLRMKFLLVDQDIMEACDSDHWITTNSTHSTVISLNSSSGSNDEVDVDEIFSDDVTRLYLVELADAESLDDDQDVSYPPGFLHPFRFAYAMETSGTSGRPKFVLVPHSCITPNIADFIHRVWRMQREDVVWGGAPSTFDPSVCDLFTAMGVGGTILYTSDAFKYDGTMLTKALFRHRVSVIQTTASSLRKVWGGLISSPYFGGVGSGSPLKVLALGGEKCLSKEELKELFSNSEKGFRSGLRAVVNLYGLTEVSCWASFGRVDPFSEDPICAGVPLLETEIRTAPLSGKDGYQQIIIESSTRICTIIDQDGRVVQEDPAILGHHAGKRIKVETGDFAILHDASDLGIEIVGRMDSMVKRSGMKIPLDLIERKAMETGFLRFAQGVEHEGKIYLVVIPKVEAPSVSGIGKNVQAYFFPFLKLDVHPEFYPNCILALGGGSGSGTTTLPVTLNGKLDLPEVLRLARQQFSCSGEYRIKEETIQGVLHPLWLTATRNPGQTLSSVMTQNFYEAGGTSSGAMWLIESLLNCLGRYGAPGLKEFTERLLRALSSAPFSSVCEVVTEEVSKNPMTAEIAVVSADAPTQTATPNYPHFDQKEDVDESKEDAGITKWLPKAREDDAILHWVEMKERLDFHNGIMISNPITAVAVMEYDLNTCVDAAPVVSLQGQNPGVCVIGSHSGLTIAVDTNELRRFMMRPGSVIPKAAAVLWAKCFPGRIEADAVINAEGSFVYLGTYGGTLYKLSIVDGSVDCRFKCCGSIRAKIGLAHDSSKAILVDDTNTIYCLNSLDLSLVWSQKLGAGFHSTFPPLIEGELVIISTILGGVTAYSVSTGGKVWPEAEDNQNQNQACTPPITWNSPRGRVIVFGVPTGFEVREVTNGALISQYRDSDSSHSWFPPVVHECRHTSEVILTDAAGLVLRASFVRDELSVIKSTIVKPIVAPSVICTRSKESDARRCYLLSKPSDQDHFVFYGLTEGEGTEQQQQQQPTLTLEHFRSKEKCFSRPLWYKDMILFGGRDDKLHILFFTPSKAKASD